MKKRNLLLIVGLLVGLVAILLVQFEAKGKPFYIGQAIENNKNTILRFQSTEQTSHVLVTLYPTSRRLFN